MKEIWYHCYVPDNFVPGSNRFGFGFAAIDGIITKAPGDIALSNFEKVNFSWLKDFHVHNPSLLEWFSQYKIEMIEIV